MKFKEVVIRWDELETIKSALNGIHQYYRNELTPHEVDILSRINHAIGYNEGVRETEELLKEKSPE